MQRAHEVKQREDYRPTPTQNLEASRRRYPAMVAKDTPAIDAPPQPSCTTGTAQFRKKSMLLGNPQHFTLQGTHCKVLSVWILCVKAMEVQCT